MSTTTVPVVPVPVRSGLSQVPGVFAAMAGRWGWRLWWPIVPWLLAAAWAWVSLSAQPQFDGDLGTWSTTASGVMLLGGLAAIPALWIWGARFALGLGHARGVVFGVTAVVSIALQAVLHLMSSTAAFVEHRLVGDAGLHVFAIETGNTFGTQDTLWNSTWIFGTYYILPVMMLIVPVSVAILRWKAWGLLGFLAIPLVVALALLAIAVVDLGLGAWLAALVYFALVAGPLGVAWAFFRRVAV